HLTALALCLDDDRARRRRPLVLVRETALIPVLHGSDRKRDRRPEGAAFLDLDLARARHRTRELGSVGQEFPDPLRRRGQHSFSGDSWHLYAPATSHRRTSV